MKNNYYPFVNEPLPYDYNALETFIDEQTMYLHHDKHLQTYINNLNEALKRCPKLQNRSLQQLIRCAATLPCTLRSAIGNNAGGVYNHRFYFEGMGQATQQEPIGMLGGAIRCCFRNFDYFHDVFKKVALSVFGSGYAWLVLDKGELRIVTTANQNSPIERCLCPILCIDIWEHAYYLKHYNRRADYIEDWFCVINWEQAEKNFLEGLKKS